MQRRTKQAGTLTSATRRIYDEEFKKNAVKPSHASNKSAGQVARDLGISNGMPYHWRAKYTPEGDKTRCAALDEENKALRLKSAEPAMAIDMLKKQSPTLRAATSEVRIHTQPNGLSCGAVAAFLEVPTSGYCAIWVRRKRPTQIA
ncbi:MAG: transposase, partial [Clostridia bacterium]